MVFNENSKISYKTKTESVIKLSVASRHHAYGLIKIDLFLVTVRRVVNFHISLHFCRVDGDEYSERNFRERSTNKL